VLATVPSSERLAASGTDWCARDDGSWSAGVLMVDDAWPEGGSGRVEADPFGALKSTTRL
jgi:hypothetical protein